MVQNGVAEHSASADGRALRAPRASTITRSGLVTRLSLSLSHDTCDGSAQPVAKMRARPGVLLDADDCTFYQRNYKCIGKGETGEALTRCAGPPAAVLSISAGTQHNTGGG